MARPKKFIGASLFPRMSGQQITVRRVNLPGQVPKPSKYCNRFKILHGIKFHSEGEAHRYEELFLLQREGHIRNLELQVVFPLHAIGGEQVSKYVADFRYEEPYGDGLWSTVVEDFKGKLTPAYKLTRRWMLAEYGIKIRESYRKGTGRTSR